MFKHKNIPHVFLYIIYNTFFDKFRQVDNEELIVVFFKRLEYNRNTYSRRKEESLWIQKIWIIKEY